MNPFSFFTETYGKLAYIDIMLICSYLIICLCVGVKTASKITNLKEYTLGIGKISTPALVATIYATYLGAGVTLGNIERVSVIGALIALVLFFKPISWWLSYNIFAKNITKFRGCITLVDIMHRLYGYWGRMISAYSSILLNIGTVAAQGFAIGGLLHYFLEIPTSVGILIGMGTITCYSTLGGIRAVVMTDILQCGIFYIIIPAIVAVLLSKVGGWEGISEMVPADRWNMSLDTAERKWMFWSCITFMVLPEFSAAGIQRYLISMNPAQLKKSLSIVAVIDLTIIATICMFGFILSAVVGTEVAPKDLIWHIMNEQLFIVVKGAAVIGMLAIIMSTADSYLNISGALIAQDIVKIQGKELMVARIGTLCTGATATVLALTGSSILELVWLATDFGIVIMVPLAAGFLGFRTNSASFVISIILSALGVVYGKYAQGNYDVLSTILALIFSAVGLFGAHYLQKVLGVLGDIMPLENGMHEDYSTTALSKANSRKKYKLQDIWDLWHKLTLQNILSYSQRSVRKHGRRYYEFATFGLLFSTYPLLFPTLSNHIYSNIMQNPMLQVDIILRMLAAFGCLSIGLRYTWKRESIRAYIPLYFHCIAMFALPALSTYAYLISPHDSRILIGGIMSIFSLAFLVDWLTFIIIMVSGFILGHVMYIIAGYLTGYQTPYILALNGSALYIIFAIAAAFVLHFIESKKTNTLYVKAHHDALTKLVNRHYLNEHLNKLIEDSHARNNPLSIIAIDIDHFKKVNDTYGHDVGDVVLQHLSKILLDSSRPLDICARLGGEEFMIVLPSTTLDEASDIAQRLRERIKGSEAVIEYKKQRISLEYTVSMGVADLQPGYNQDMLMKVADDALYEAKKLGRDRVEVASLPEEKIKGYV